MGQKTQDFSIPATRRSEKQTFKIMPLLSGKYKIEFYGNLPLGWAGSLAQGLANRRVNILSGYAKRISMSQWIGEIMVESDAAASLPAIDFKTIVNERLDMAHQRLVLADFRIRECFKANGSVYVEVDGQDQLGFLAGVLKKFMSCCLFPWEFSIKTEDGYISDSFHLMGTSGIHVSPQMMSMLMIKLQESMN
jgi:hypothetical protein